MSDMPLCSYGCGNEAIITFKNGKHCCSKYYSQCDGQKRIGKQHHMFNKKCSVQTKLKMSKSHIGHLHSDSSKIKRSIKMTGENNPMFGIIRSKISRKKQSLTNKYTIEQIKKIYPIFSIIEEMKYSDEKEIQVHCKNHNCPNSKEQGGWFIPTQNQIYERSRQLEHSKGNDGSYFYCCDDCKNECPLFNLRSDPNNKQIEYFTGSEYQTWRQEVLKRSEHICEYCGEKAIHVHHSRPQKLEPFHSLDPDFGIACCESCHYKYGHKDECSTGQLANKVCI